jgi:hypothetical protein
MCDRPEQNRLFLAGRLTYETLHDRMVVLHLRLPTLIALGALITAWLVTMDIGAGPLRAVIVLGFLLLGPGAAYVPLLRLANPSYTLILSVALSLAIDLLVAAAAVYSGFWSPPLIMNILVGLTFVGVLLQVLPGIGGSNQTDRPEHEPGDPTLVWSQGEPHAES